MTDQEKINTIVSLVINNVMEDQDGDGYLMHSNIISAIYETVRVNGTSDNDDDRILDFVNKYKLIFKRFNITVEEEFSEVNMYYRGKFVHVKYV